MRARLLTDLGMVDQRLRTPFNDAQRATNDEASLKNLIDARLEQLCARPDAPAWIVVPGQVMEGAPVSVERWKPQHWTAPSPAFAFGWDGKRVNWTATQDYAVIPCAS
ncbi:MAG TPA: hypothetical protein VMW57_06965 [Methyloceanibacter sp.]|nr:hypothetical protein [Methyloceanibacter sp.]